MLCITLFQGKINEKRLRAASFLRYAPIGNLFLFLRRGIVRLQLFQYFHFQFLTYR